MFNKMLGKKKINLSQDDNETVFKISKMNLVEMRAYVNNKIKDFKLSEEGLIAVMRRLNSTHEGTTNRFIELDAMDVKIKKAFELVMLISKSKKITVVATELIQDFINIYEDLINKYDISNKDIYYSRLQKSVEKAMKNINEMTEYKRKMEILKGSKI